LTLETGAAFFGAALRAAGLGVGFLAFTADLDFAAVFLAVAVFAALRATGLAAAALRAFGLEADFVLTTRFALFAAGLTFERDVDRLRPFVRLLLMGGISKGCSPVASSPWNSPQLTTDTPLDQRTQPFAGALRPKIRSNLWTNVSTKKNT